MRPRIWLYGALMACAVFHLDYAVVDAAEGELLTLGPSEDAGLNNLAELLIAKKECADFSLFEDKLQAYLTDRGISIADVSKGGKYMPNLVQKVEFIAGENGNEFESQSDYCAWVWDNFGPEGEAIPGLLSKR